MKIFSILFAVSTSLSFAVESTTIEFKLEGEHFVSKNKTRKVSISALNKKLKELKVDGLPKLIKLSSTANTKAFWTLLSKNITKANEALKREMTFVIEGGYIQDYPAICYRGSIEGVEKIIKSMESNFFNESQGILAIRYKKNIKFLAEDLFKTKESRAQYADNGYEDEVNSWEQFDQKSDTVLISRWREMI